MKQKVKVFQIFNPKSLRNFSYILANPVNSECYIIDPFCFKEVRKLIELNNLKPIALLNTHHHDDHIRNNDEVLEYYQIKKIPNDKDKKIYFTETQYIQMIFTPGHVDDHFCYLGFEENKQSFIIAGDTVFNAGVGHCKLPTGDVNVLQETTLALRNLLEDSCLMYPAHDYFKTNLEFTLSLKDHERFSIDEALVNSWLQRRLKRNLDEEFIQTNMADEKEINLFFRFAHNKELFLELRSFRDSW
ncbi:MAG: hydroxyacylglutathione hydrolase [Thermoproteota archaeon]|jgi:hydroxyacylglutathione hydrolase